MAISGRVGAVYVTDPATAPVPFTNAATTVDPNSGYTRYQVTNRSWRYWPLDANITVRRNGNVITTGFELERPGGYVVFEAPNLATDVITVSGTALTLVQAAGMFKWSIDLESDSTETSTFGSSGWKEYLTTARGWSGSAEAYWVTSDLWNNVLGEIVVVRLAFAANQAFEGFAIIKSEGLETPVDEIVTQSLEFDGVDKIYLHLWEA